MPNFTYPDELVIIFIFSFYFYKNWFLWGRRKWDWNMRLCKEIEGDNSIFGTGFFFSGANLDTLNTRFYLFFTGGRGLPKIYILPPAAILKNMNFQSKLAWNVLEEPSYKQLQKGTEIVFQSEYVLSFNQNFHACFFHWLNSNFLRFALAKFSDNYILPFVKTILRLVPFFVTIEIDENSIFFLILSDQ